MNFKNLLSRVLVSDFISKKIVSHSIIRWKYRKQIDKRYLFSILKFLNWLELLVFFSKVVWSWVAAIFVVHNLQEMMIMVTTLVIIDHDHDQKGWRNFYLVDILKIDTLHQKYCLLSEDKMYLVLFQFIQSSWHGWGKQLRMWRKRFFTQLFPNWMDPRDLTIW